MIRDKTHNEHIEKWANFVKTNPHSAWQPQLNRFINAQIENANRFYSELSKTEEGREKIKKLMALKDAKQNAGKNQGNKG